MAAYDILLGYPALGFDLPSQYQVQSNPSPLYSASTASDLTLVGDCCSSRVCNVSAVSPRSPKKNKVAGQKKLVEGGVKVNIQMPATEAAAVLAAHLDMPGTHAGGLAAMGPAPAEE